MAKERLTVSLDPGLVSDLRGLVTSVQGNSGGDVTLSGTMAEVLKAGLANRKVLRESLKLPSDDDTAVLAETWAHYLEYAKRFEDVLPQVERALPFILEHARSYRDSGAAHLQEQNENATQWLADDIFYIALAAVCQSHALRALPLVMYDPTARVGQVAVLTFASARKEGEFCLDTRQRGLPRPGRTALKTRLHTEDLALLASSCRGDVPGESLSEIRWEFFLHLGRQIAEEFDQLIFSSLWEERVNSNKWGGRDDAPLHEVPMPDRTGYSDVLRDAAVRVAWRQLLREQRLAYLGHAPSRMHAVCMIGNNMDPFTKTKQDMVCGLRRAGDPYTVDRGETPQGLRLIECSGLPPRSYVLLGPPTTSLVRGAAIVASPLFGANPPFIDPLDLTFVVKSVTGAELAMFSPGNIRWFRIGWVDNPDAGVQPVS